MKAYYYVGLDIHKKTVSYCMKSADGTIVDEGSVLAKRRDLNRWARGIEVPWSGAMEATLFTGWVYDELLPYAEQLEAGHSLMLRAIASSKKKSDRIDARTLSDLLRCNLFPRCYMAPRKQRDLRRMLRYRNMLVAEVTRMKNKLSGLLMEVGAEYNKSKLHGKSYFRRLLESLDYVPESVLELLRMTRSNIEFFEVAQRRVIEALKIHPDLRERVERLRTIQGVGEVTALTWALEIGDPHRFASRKKAVSYCGLCSSLNESAGVAKRMPLSKQRNKHLQTVLVEAANLAPRWNPQLAHVYETQITKGADKNRATLAVARKLVAYMLYVDKTGKEFKPRDVN